MLFTNCVENLNVNSKNNDNSGLVAIHIQANLPTANIINRAPNQASESTIYEVDALVFKNDILQYTMSGYDIVQNDNEVSFTTNLSASAEQVEIFVVANSQNLIKSNINTGDSKDQVKTILNYTFSNDINYIPMVGSLTMPHINSSSSETITGINLLRAMAKAEVFISSDQAHGASKDFELKSLMAYRVNSHMQIIPNSIINGKVTTPSIPASSTQSIKVTNSTEQAFTMFLPESEANNKNATCLVVGGSYKGETTTYYRIDFGADITNLGKILRNHKYNFRITEVLSSGFPTAEEAANSNPTNIIVEVSAWDETTKEIIFDKDYYLGVSTREPQVWFRQNSEVEIDVSTNIESYSLQWASGGEVEDSIKNQYFNVCKSADGTKITVTALTNNENNNEIVNPFLIVTPSWTVEINIHQTYKPEFD